MFDVVNAHIHGPSCVDLGERSESVKENRGSGGEAPGIFFRPLKNFICGLASKFFSEPASQARAEKQKR